MGHGEVALLCIQEEAAIAMMWEMPLVLTGYLLGSVPFGLLIARAAKGVDIRTLGSGNIGATNVSRFIGRGWGLVAFALDVLKGFVPAYAGLILSGKGLGAIAGLAAIAGHNWPLFLGFRGGKGVATSCGVFLAIFPLGLLISLGVWASAVAAWRYVSVGSLLAGVALLVTALLLQDDPIGKGRSVTALAGVAAVLTFVRHRSNIRRLLQGTESKIGRKNSER